MLTHFFVEIGVKVRVDEPRVKQLNTINAEMAQCSFGNFETLCACAA